MRKLLIFLSIPLFLLAQEDLTPEQIQEELDADEAQFKHAKEMFNPWYAGPLLTGSAHMMPPGYIGIQPYIFVTDTYASYNGDWHSVGSPDLVQLNPQVSALQAGITDWLDASLAMQGFTNWKEGVSSGGLGDTNLTLGLRLVSEGAWMPAMKIGVGETFPTGKYQKLSADKNGTDSTGAGSYQTALSFRIAKLFFWATNHPLNLRSTFTWTIPSSVHVRGINAYGGGTDTNGSMDLGYQYNVSFGLEWSFTQKWVFCNDFIYVHSNEDTFSGTPGISPTGTPFDLNIPSSEQFSLCPGIEYNPTSDLNFLAGVWFTVAGRNSGNFISGIVSMSYTFAVK